jgi:hypothetical protein
LRGGVAACEDDFIGREGGVTVPNWCNSSIAFYQEDGGNCILEAFYTDIERYQNFADVNGSYSNWCGHYLIANQIDTDSIYCRGFFTNCELYSDYVRIDMETAWSPLPEVYDLLAKKYNLSYVYISEEPGSEIYINTDVNARFFSTRYLLDYFEVEDLGLDEAMLAEYGTRLKALAENTHYYDTFDEVMEDFKDFGFHASTLDKLNKCLELFNLEIYEYSTDGRCVD